MQIPIHGDELADAVRLLGDEFDFKTGRQRETRLLLLRGHRLALAGRLGDCPIAAGVVRGLLRRRCADESLFRRRGRQFFDGDVPHLHERLAAAVDLDAEFSPVRNVRIWLDVIGAQHAVEPGGHARSVGANRVIVPALRIRVERRTERFHVGGGHHLVPARFVVEATVPGRLAVIRLVTGHLGIVRHALRTKLETRIEKPIRAKQPNLETHDEISVGPRTGQKLILLHGLGERAARQRAILHTPEFEIALPTGQRPPVEHRNRPARRRRGFGGWSIKGEEYDTGRAQKDCN